MRRRSQPARTRSPAPIIGTARVFAVRSDGTVGTAEVTFANGRAHIVSCEPADLFDFYRDVAEGLVHETEEAALEAWRRREGR